jgi:phosphatidylinositol alpha-mannosyltransferase
VRIALVHPYSWPEVRRGGERYLHDLERWLTDRGHDVDLVTGAVPRLGRFGATPLDTFGLDALPRLARQRYDVVHALVPSGGLAAAALLQPSVYSVLGHPSLVNPPSPHWRRRLMTRAVRTVRVATVLSRSAADGLEGLTGRRPLVVPPGVRTADFAPKEGPVTGPPRLLFNAFAGDPRKRLGVLLAALPAVLEQHPGTRLALGGGGDLQPVLDALEPGVRRAVEPVLDDLGTGDLADVPARYREATVSVLPSVDEAFGLVLAESLACGTPVVCTGSGGPAEIVTDPLVGCVAEPDDARSLAQQVISALALAADPATVERCAAHARRWDWDVVGPLHESAYRLARG